MVQNVCAAERASKASSAEHVSGPVLMSSTYVPIFVLNHSGGLDDNVIVRLKIGTQKQISHVSCLIITPWRHWHPATELSIAMPRDNNQSKRRGRRWRGWRRDEGGGWW